MTWRFLVTRYAVIIGFNEAFRSGRWTDDEKAVALFLAGAAVTWPVLISLILWVLTGRGPARWWFRPAEVAFVNPFPMWRHPDPGGAFERLARDAPVA